MGAAAALEQVRAGALPLGARITFLINSMEGGGAERAMANLLRHLLPHLSGYRVELLLLDDLPMRQFLPEGLRVHVLDGRGRIGRSFLELARYWQSSAHRPDICVSFLARANVLNVWLSRRFRHRAIISERVQTSSHIAGSRAAPLLAAITRLSYPRADRVIAVGKGVADDLSERFSVPPAKLSVIGNAIDAARLKQLAAEPSSVDLPADFFLGMGRLVPNKNFAHLLDAYAMAAPGPELVILGQGPQEVALRDRAKRLGIGERVRFEGFLENPYPVVQRARALVSSSRAEGFPNTLVEAMSLACPVIATDCPTGPAELLSGGDGEPSGILVPMEDRAAMAAAIGALCDDAVQQDYSVRAETRARDFGPEPVVEAYLDLLLSRGV